MADDGTGARRGRGRRPALHAAPGPLGRALESAFRNRIALDADGKARGVHHDEHVFEAAIGSTDEVAHRAARVSKGKHARGTRMNPQLVFD